MTLGYTIAVRNAQLAQLASRFDAGTTGATVKIYSGARPATADTAIGGGNTLLLTITLATAAFGAQVNGSMSLAGLPIDAIGVAAGTASWFRAADSDGTTVTDGTCGADGSGADVELSTTTISVGLEVSLIAGTITQP
jgi:hypothetical protein